MMEAHDFSKESEVAYASMVPLHIVTVAFDLEKYILRRKLKDLEWNAMAAYCLNHPKATAIEAFFEMTKGNWVSE